MPKYTVKFTGEAAEEWRTAYPNLPPGEEIVLEMEVGACKVCGNEIQTEQIGGLDPTYIDEDGVLHGEHVCLDCMKKGH